MKMPSLEQQQADIMDRFNFERVLVAMHALNWTWIGETVTLDKLKATAMSLMNDVQKEYNQENGWRSVATGGFEARIDPICGCDRMSLMFCVESIDAAVEEY
jgi:hypothetical protein